MRRTAAAAAAVAFLLLAVLGWPAATGGSTTYLAIRGASMRPAVAAGDLAILRAGTPYRVGQIAGYRSAGLHHVVLHRIAAIDGGTYTFKGDANSFLDPQPVPRSAVVGRLAVRIPLLGSALLWLAHPFNLLLLLLLGASLTRDRWRTPRAEMAAARLELPGDRLVPISDMSFPHELAVADVPSAESLLRLAEQYDRPVLHDEAESLLFVVESSMLFRCALPREEPQASPAAQQALSVVRELRSRSVQPEPTWEQRRPPVPAGLRRDGRPVQRGRDWDYGHRPAAEARSDRPDAASR